MLQFLKHPVVRLALFALVLELCGALSLIAGVLTYTQSRANNEQVQAAEQALSQRIAILDHDLDAATKAQQVQAASAKASTALTEHLLQEINFICTTSAARAEESGLPPPPAGLCDLAIPTPSP